ncbi:hypothetical protein GWK41_00160 [Persephonella atlantica]|uniref:DUF485 domain-containing protein n=1 Tax=Persephonella atlantica TaxID=2699429 RepID=A0ABS1GEU4_9AQUI|nr:hypothetical protein [Persephonella atlantica]MBK3331473.1 hypothetical protein [Persephonella atlantica]
MLTEKEKEFVNSRRKLIKLAFPFAVFLVFMWFSVYIFMIIFFPEVCNLSSFQNRKDIGRLTPVFFNLFMVVLLVLFVFMIVSIKNEEQYLKILNRFIKGQKPPKG